MNRETLSPELTNLHEALMAEAADNYLYYRIIKDVEQAEKWGKQLITLCAVNHLPAKYWYETAQRYLLESSDGNAVVEDYARNTAFFSDNPQQLRDMGRTSAASVSPPGSYSPNETVHGFVTAALKIQAKTANDSDIRVAA